MSLINDMLQDLDRRGQRKSDSESNGADGRDALSTGGGLAQPNRWGWLPATAVFVLVILVVWLGRYWLDSEEQETSAELAQTMAPARESPPDSGDESEHLAHALAEPEFVVNTSASETPGPVQASAVPDHTARIDTTVSSLLSAAERARQRDRLTQPAQDNAFDYYQQVLSLVPEHSQALAGLVAIARRYLELAEAAMDQNDLNRARRFVQRARSVDPDVSGITASAERLQRLSAVRDEQALDELGEEFGEGPGEEPGKELDSANREQARAEPDNGETPHLEVRLDLASRDRRIAERVRQRWETGDRTGARVELEQALSELRTAASPSDVASGPVKSTALLAELYLEAGEVARARALVANADYLPALERARQRANIALHEGDQLRAIEHLESELSGARSDEHYRAQLARLYYAEGQHRRAVDSYQRLLSDFGEHPAYWLGLGLAQDALDQSAPALQAFRRAEQSGAYGRDSSVGRYLGRRIAVLSRQIDAQEP